MTARIARVHGRAGMAELADAADLKSADLRVVGVRVPLPVPARVRERRRAGSCTITLDGSGSLCNRRAPARARREWPARTGLAGVRDLVVDPDLLHGVTFRHLVVAKRDDLRQIRLVQRLHELRGRLMAGQHLIAQLRARPVAHRGDRLRVVRRDGPDIHAVECVDTYQTLVLVQPTGDRRHATDGVVRCPVVSELVVPDLDVVQRGRRARAREADSISQFLRCVHGGSSSGRGPEAIGSTTQPCAIVRFPLASASEREDP